MAHKVLSPSKLAHVVLRTGRFKEMCVFYKTFLGGSASFENNFLSFITYDDEHHRIAIASIPGLKDKDTETAGLEHTAFSYNTLEELTQAYSQRKDLGILPIMCLNHGPTTSIYYADPDGNQIETQVDNFDTPEEATEFMMSKYFNANPIGVPFDPEDLIKRLRSGVDHKRIKARPDTFESKI
ncbi:putative ring-cleavage extradiol dioxygenase [Bisporella sp. PMI_857]|nr:putative ring-cleavage extradiol dioxygenase [Bisporella sp. PMI_857]